MPGLMITLAVHTGWVLGPTALIGSVGRVPAPSAFFIVLARSGSVSKPIAIETLGDLEVGRISLSMVLAVIYEEAEHDAVVCCVFVLRKDD